MSEEQKKLIDETVENLKQHYCNRKDEKSEEI